MYKMKRNLNTINQIKNETPYQEISQLGLLIVRKEMKSLVTLAPSQLWVKRVQNVHLQDGIITQQ